MQAHQLFQSISPTLSQGIIIWMRDEEKNVYKAAVSTIAQQRKLRPVFITQKPRDVQVTFLVESLKLRALEAVGENVLQVWLLKGRSTMLATFLDAIEVKHDGKGGVEGDVPKTLDGSKVAVGVKNMLAQHPAEEVAVYLHMFQMQQPGGWPEIAASLADNQLLGAPAAK